MRWKFDQQTYTWLKLSFKHAKPGKLHRNIHPGPFYSCVPRNQSSRHVFLVKAHLPEGPYQGLLSFPPLGRVCPSPLRTEHNGLPQYPSVLEAIESSSPWVRALYSYSSVFWFPLALLIRRIRTSFCILTNIQVGNRISSSEWVECSQPSFAGPYECVGTCNWSG